MTKWTKVELDYVDDVPEIASDGTTDGLVQRKNIEIIDATEDKPKHIECEQRYLTVSEYEMLNAMQNIYAGKTEV